MRGWIYCDTHTTTDSRQIKITKVEKGSPADGILEVGDVILGVYGKLFDDDTRILFGKAITKAEKTENLGKLPLIRWRNGKTAQVVIRLKPMGSYSSTAPFNCPKSKKIVEQGCAALAKKMKANPTGGPIISRALNATALLASGNPKYLPVVRQQAKLLSQYDQSSGVVTWNYGFVNIFLAEYVLATGDRTYVDEGLKRITKMAVDGQALVGSYGHRFADPKTKRLSGYGMMNSPGLLLTYSMVLAQRAGVDVPGLEKAIDKSTTFLKFYVGKGAIPYGDHNPWIETHDDNGKCGLAAVLFDHQGNADATEFYSRMSVADHGVRRDEGHTGNFFNMTWALPGVVRSGANASGAWIEEFGKLLIEAVRLGLKNEDGRERGSLASVYENLTFDELKPLLPDIYQAIKEQAPSDIMFSAEIRMAGLKLFADNHISEGIELLTYYARNQRQHASEKRIDKIMDMLKMYGAHGKRVNDQLEAVAYFFENEEKNFPRKLNLGKAKVVRETIKAIKASTDKPRLIYLRNKRGRSGGKQ